MLQKINLLLILGYLHAVDGDIREPTCYSRFDYDEKMLLKLLKIEDKIQKFQGSIDEIKDNYEQEKTERRKVFDSEMDSLRLQNVDEVEKQKNLTAEIQEAVMSAMTQLEAHLQKAQEARKDDVVAFTVTSPSNGPVSNSITFSKVVTNKGDGFDTTTGKFTCTVSGLYYFSVHLTKKRSSGVDAAGCHLKKNGQSSVRAFIDPQDGATGADNGSYGMSTAVYLELEAGDVISLEDCSSGASGAVESWSTMSGFLAKPKV